jgi:hypothetical protein
LKRVRESCTWSSQDYHITTRDITRFQQIAENKEIWLAENDAVSITVWVTLIQQDGGKAFLKDKLDPPPPGSGLAPDTFVLCIQTNFQKEQFQRLGSNFVSIDATHNTTHYLAISLFTLIVRDPWGHGALRFVVHFLFWLLKSFLCGRCTCHVDGRIQGHRSDDQIFSQFHQNVEPGDHTHDHHE